MPVVAHYRHSHVNLAEYKIISADAITCEITLFIQRGETKKDLSLPDQVGSGAFNDYNKQLTQQIVTTIKKGETNLVGTVLSAGGIEEIVECRIHA